MNFLVRWDLGPPHSACRGPVPSLWAENLLLNPNPSIAVLDTSSTVRIPMIKPTIVLNNINSINQE